MKIEAHWLEREGIKGDELRATWGKFGLEVSGRWVTDHYVGRGQSKTETHLTAPIYPIAEWVVGNWWHLLYEPYVRNRTTASSFESRHNLMFSSEGFAVPNCRIETQGGQHVLTARAFRFPFSRAEFTNSLGVSIESDIIERALKGFVESVISRLEQQGLLSTPLQAAWSQIKNHEPEEVIFCQAAAMLGYDPYGLDVSTEEKIIRAYNSMSSDSFWELLAASTGTDILSDLREFEKARETSHYSNVSSELYEFKSSHMQNSNEVAPWAQGYRRAQEFRKFLSIDGALTDQNVRTLFGLDTPVDSLDTSRSDWMDAIVESGARTEVRLALGRSRGDSTRFRLCRCAYEYLASVEGSPRLVTRGRTKNQAENRAFAAELLVPASELEERIGGNEVSKEDIEAISGEYGVSTYVVEHQLENHSLAVLPK